MSIDISVNHFFVCYRRDDAGDYAGRIADLLRLELGSDRVFIDVDSIRVGTDWHAALRNALNDAIGVVVVIGPTWLTIERDGRPRLSFEDDWVRTEIREALAAGKDILPIVKAGATVPTAEALPEDIRALASRQALEIHAQRFSRDATALVEWARRITPATPSLPAPAKRSPVYFSSLSRVTQAILVLAACLVATGLGIGGGVYFENYRRREDFECRIVFLDTSEHPQQVEGTIRLQYAGAEQQRELKNETTALFQGIPRMLKGAAPATVVLDSPRYRIANTDSQPVLDERIEIHVEPVATASKDSSDLTLTVTRISFLAPKKKAPWPVVVEGILSNTSEDPLTLTSAATAVGAPDRSSPELLLWDRTGNLLSSPLTVPPRGVASLTIKGSMFLDDELRSMKQNGVVHVEHDDGVNAATLLFGIEVHVVGLNRSVAEWTAPIARLTMTTSRPVRWMAASAPVPLFPPPKAADIPAEPRFEQPIAVLHGPALPPDNSNSSGALERAQAAVRKELCADQPNDCEITFQTKQDHLHVLFKGNSVDLGAASSIDDRDAVDRVRDVNFGQH